MPVPIVVSPPVIKPPSLVLWKPDIPWPKQSESSNKPYNSLWKRVKNGSKPIPHSVVPLCLGACGPYGAYLADGSEYRGHYDVSDETWIDFHTKRAQLLWESGADLLLFETEPSLHEALIEAEIAETMKADYWSVFHVKMVAILVKEPHWNLCRNSFKRPSALKKWWVAIVQILSISKNWSRACERT